MKKATSLILVLAMSLALCIPAFADEGEIPVDSAADVEIAYNEEAEMLEDDIARNNKPPRALHDLSKKSYEMAGTFDSSIYTLYYFKPDANGKISYSVDLTFVDEVEIEDGDEDKYLPTLTVECWDRTDNKLAIATTFKSKSNIVRPFFPTISSGNRAITGLNPDHEYYFLFRKDMWFRNANITGVIWHSDKSLGL